MKRWRLALCVVLAGLAVPVAVGAAGMITAADGVYTPREATAPPAPAAPTATGTASPASTTQSARRQRFHGRPPSGLMR